MIAAVCQLEPNNAYKTMQDLRLKAAMTSSCNDYGETM